MFNRDNAVGIILLGACAVVAVIMIIAIQTGERPNIDFGSFGNVAIGILFIGLIIFGIVRNRRSSGGGNNRQWPDPRSGAPRKSLWDRLRGR